MFYFFNLLGNIVFRSIKIRIFFSSGEMFNFGDLVPEQHNVLSSHRNLISRRYSYR